MTALTTKRSDWNPWRDFFDIDGLFNQAIDSREAKLARAPIDFYEDENKYTLKADFPGVKKEDLKVDFKDGVLTLVGIRHEDAEDKSKKEGYFRKERYVGRMERQINLGDKIDPSKVEALFESGVLKMTLPKKSDQKTITIKIS